MKKRLYAAYGSNLNLAQMKRRCPTAKLVGTGEIKDYELQFKGSPQGAFATVAPKQGSSVPVAVWELKPADERALDCYEGYPSHYFKSDVPVSIDGRDKSVMAYIMNLRMGFGLPSEHYYKTVSDGYNDCGLDRATLKEAVGRNAQRYYESTLTAPAYQFSLYSEQAAGKNTGASGSFFDEDSEASDIDIEPEEDEDYDIYGGAFDDYDDGSGDADYDDPDVDDGFGPFGGMEF